MDEGYCDKEEDYSSISKGVEESGVTVESPRSGHHYITPGVLLEVISRASSPERIVNIDSSSTMTSTQEKTPLLYQSSDNLDANTMVGVDIQLPTFNGNGIEYPEQHWFICEVVWMV